MGIDGDCDTSRLEMHHHATSSHDNIYKGISGWHNAVSMIDGEKAPRSTTDTITRLIIFKGRRPTTELRNNLKQFNAKVQCTIVM